MKPALQQQSHHTQRHAVTHQWLGQPLREIRVVASHPEPDQKTGEQFQQKGRDGEGFAQTER